MKRLLKAFSAAVSLTLISSGCVTKYSDVPAPVRFERTEQSKLQSVSHWNVIAEHFAEALLQDLQAKNSLTKPLYLLPAGRQDFPFVEGFRELLTTALVKNNIPVSTTASGAMPVDIRYSAYLFDHSRVHKNKMYGLQTLSVAGVWALEPFFSDAAVPFMGKLLAATALGEAWEMFMMEGTPNPFDPSFGKTAKGPVPKTEIIVTASVSDNSRIVARRSNVYFTADEDAALYWQRNGSGRSTTLPVKGE